MVTDQDLKGRPFLVFFGFTHCPDVCPTALFEVSEIMRALGPRRRPHARAVHHGRSRARHAGGDQGLSVELRSASDRSHRRSGRGRGGGQGLPRLFQEGPARPGRLHHGPHRHRLSDGQGGPLRLALQPQADDAKPPPPTCASICDPGRATDESEGPARRRQACAARGRGQVAERRAMRRSCSRSPCSITRPASCRGREPLPAGAGGRPPPFRQPASSRHHGLAARAAAGRGRGDRPGDRDRRSRSGLPLQHGVRPAVARPPARRRPAITARPSGSSPTTSRRTPISATCSGSSAATAMPSPPTSA